MRRSTRTQAEEREAEGARMRARACAEAVEIEAGRDELLGGEGGSTSEQLPARSRAAAAPSVRRITLSVRDRQASSGAALPALSPTPSSPSLRSPLRSAAGLAAAGPPSGRFAPPVGLEATPPAASRTGEAEAEVEAERKAGALPPPALAELKDDDMLAILEPSSQ